MAYGILHILAFVGVIFGWLICTVVVFPVWLYNKEDIKVNTPKLLDEEQLQEIFPGSVIPVTKVQKVEADLLIGVWFSYVLVRTWSDQKMEMTFRTAYYQPKSKTLFLRDLLSQFYSMFNLTVGLWSIIAGFMDCLYFRGRSTTSVGLAALMAALAGPPTCFFMNSGLSNLLVASFIIYLYLFGCVIMGVSGAGLVVLPPPKPRESEETNLPNPGKIE